MYFVKCFTCSLYLLSIVSYCSSSQVLWNPHKLFLLENKGISSVENKRLDLSMIDPRIDILILNFFAPDCPPCIEEVPELLNFYKEHIEESSHIKLIFIGSTLEQTVTEDPKKLYQDDVKVLKNFIRKYNIPEPIYYANKFNLRSYGITGFPETFVLYRNKKGNFFVKRKFISKVTEKLLRPYILYTETKKARSYIQITY